jgi:hypothetical protein
VPEDRDGVTKFQHRAKISSILIRNKVAPTAARLWEAIWRLSASNHRKSRSCYECHPPGRSKTLRTAWPDFVDQFRQLRKASLNSSSSFPSQSQKKNPPGESGGLQHLMESFGKQPIEQSSLTSKSPMRIRTYRDQTFSRHFDLIGGRDHPWSIDLVSLAVSILLVVGFVCALLAQLVH